MGLFSRVHVNLYATMLVRWLVGRSVGNAFGNAFGNALVFSIFRVVFPSLTLPNPMRLFPLCFPATDV